MALSLSAEQRDIYSLFVRGESRYVIPEYQRSYAWGEDECKQLYYDITNAFKDACLKCESEESCVYEDYFLGTIILARPINDKSSTNVVDGQQRMITLWLFMKCLSLLIPNNRKIEQGLWIEPRNLEENVPIIKISSLDGESSVLKEIWETKAPPTDIDLKSIKDDTARRVQQNYRVLYDILKPYVFDVLNTDSKKQLFWDFFSSHIALLPIEMTGITMNDAEKKAMIIFETINNRGLNLTDADIFKARLYSKAREVRKTDNFIRDWNSVVSRSNALLGEKGVDELFRYYMHVIRGRKGIVRYESGLRDFFINDKDSPFLTQPYDEVIHELKNIVDVLSYMKSMTEGDNIIAPWLQVLDLYPQRHPKYAVCAYLLRNGISDQSEETMETRLAFLKNVARCCYSTRSTNSIKFKIFQLVREASFNSCVEEKTYNVDRTILNAHGKHGDGYALLAFILSNNIRGKVALNWDWIYRDEDEFVANTKWTGIYGDYAWSLANRLISELPYSNANFVERAQVYRQSIYGNVLKHQGTDILSSSTFLQYESSLQDSLIKFFINNLKDVHQD